MRFRPVLFALAVAVVAMPAARGATAPSNASPDKGGGTEAHPQAGTTRHHHSTRHHHETATAHRTTRREPHGTTRHPHAASPGTTTQAPVATKPVTPVPPPAPPKPPVGSSTGLPLPRYASLRADEVNLRAGPGTQYPIQWVFKHQNMPVEIRREFDVWRLIAAPDGTVGWVHQATLIGARTFTVPDGSAVVTVRRAPDDTAGAVAELEPGAIGRVVRCDANDAWCRVSVRELGGYVPRSAIWGLLPNEAVGVPTP